MPEAADLTQKETSLLEELDKWERWLEKADAEARQARKRAEELRNESEKAEKKYSASLKRMEHQKKLVATRLRAAYMMGRVAEAEFLFASEGVADFSLRNHYLDCLMKQDEKTFHAYFDSVGETREAREKSIEAKRQAEEIAQKLEEKLAVMRQGVATRKAMLKEIRGSSKLRKRFEKEKKQASQDLARKIRKMPKQKGNLSFSESKGELPCPVKGRIVANFGNEETDIGNVYHRGIKIQAPEGRPVRAISKGVVRFAGRFKGYGNLIILDHGAGYHTLFANLQSIAQPQGVEVEAGDVLGYVGSTGSLDAPGLYFEIRKKGRPQDPEEWAQCR